MEPFKGAAGTPNRKHAKLRAAEVDAGEAPARKRLFFPEFWGELA